MATKVDCCVGVNNWVDECVGWVFRITIPSGCCFLF